VNFVTSDGNAADRLRIHGDFSLNSGGIAIGFVEAFGNVTIGNQSLGGTTNLIFSETRQQVFTNNGGVNPGGTWTVDKPYGRVTTVGNMTLPSFARLFVNSGIFYLGPGSNLPHPPSTSGPLTVAPAGKLLADSNNVITSRRWRRQQRHDQSSL
jgi:hypothetical protein